MIKEKLEKIKQIIDSVKEKTESISKEDLQVEDYYKYGDGTIFTKKMYNDLIMWKSFESDYNIDIIGILKLREILGKPEDFKDKYIK